MEFEFRSISDMAGDVKTVLEAMTDGGEPVFKDVLVCRQTAYAELAQVIENQVATPAAVEKNTARNSASAASPRPSTCAP